MKHQNIQLKLNELRKNKRFRKARTLTSRGILISEDSTAAASRQMINLSSNDYLGLSGDTELQALFFDSTMGANASNWMGACSSRALTGTSPSHTQLETNIAQSYRQQRALILNSGYHANCGIIPAITNSSDLVLTDKLIHASLIDGVRLGKAAYKRFAHNNMAILENILHDSRDNYDNVWIVTESLFSMDGDYAPLSQLVKLKEQYDANLYVDEAHAVGCLGKNGLGLSEQLGLLNKIDLLVGTFGKALAGYGGYVTGDRVLIEAIENFARPWIFSTALPPVMIDWNTFIWQRIPSLGLEREQLHRSAKTFREGLNSVGLACLGDSYIIPLLVPGNSQVIALASRLESAQILALPIRSPTVAVAAERVRFSLSAKMSASEIERCIQEIKNAQ